MVEDSPKTNPRFFLALALLLGLGIASSIVAGRLGKRTLEAVFITLVAGFLLGVFMGVGSMPGGKYRCDTVEEGSLGAPGTWEAGLMRDDVRGE